MTTVDYRSVEVDEQAERTDRARRAVQAFNRMLPMLNNYARTFTGNPRVQVRAHASSNGATDGTSIFFRPPISLGDEHKHVKKLCDKRDEDTLAQLCRACELREQVLVVIYHEIAHICYGTFSLPTQAAQADLLRRAVEASGTKYAAAITERINRLSSSIRHSYLAMAGQVSPFLPIILNAVEDARVNNSLFTARKGTRMMFDADTLRTFTQGVEVPTADGGVKYLAWNEREQNLQLIVGLYCAVSEYPYADWFIQPVVAVLDDEIVQQLVVQARTTKNVDDNYQISFKFLDRFRQLGFCKSATDPEDEEPQPEPEAEPDNEDNEDTDGDEDDESDEQSAGSEPSPDDTGGETPSEEPAEAGGADPGDGDEDSTPGDPEDEDLDGGTEEGETPSSDGASEDEQSNADEATGGEGASSEDDEETDQFGDADSGTAEPEENDSNAEESDQPGSGSSGQEPEEPEQGDSDSDEGDPSEDEGEVGSGEIGRDAPEAEADDPGQDGGGASPAVAGEEDGSAGDDTGADDEGMGDGSDSFEPDLDDEGVDDSDEEAAADGDTGAGDDSGPDDGDESTFDGDESFDDGEASTDLGDGEAEHFEYDPEADNEAEIDPEAETKIDVPEEPEERPAGEDDEAIDTGADEGMGGIEVVEAETDYSSVPMGDAAEVQDGLDKFGHHEEVEQTQEDRDNEDALLTAIMQGMYFETPSETIAGVRIHEYGQPIVNSMGENMSTAWGGKLYLNHYSRRDLGIDGDFKPEESIVGRQLLKLRVVFADNQRSHNQNHLKSGRVNTRVLGRRAPLQDERLFRKKLVPGKKSYFVAIALDISGSTVGKNLQLIKAAAWAQADLLTRLGIPFAMYGCSGYYDTLDYARQMFLDIYPVKHENEPWNRTTQERMQELGPDGGNLDGHNLEFMRKLCDKSQATDKIIMYYSDGKMPATNHDEELEILRRELTTCKKKGYVVAGVGVRTDSPSRHGLPTVQIDTKNDVGKVVNHLEAMLRSKL